MAKTEIINSLEVASQIPLDVKLVVKTLAELEDLGENNFKASKYYEDMVVRCLENHISYIWREEKYVGEPKGLLETSYIYPTGSSTTEPEVDYSNRIFNFFEADVFGVDLANRLKALNYINAVAEVNANIEFFEEGVFTTITYDWLVTQNDDGVVNNTFNGDATTTNNSGSKVITTSTTSTKTLVTNIKRNLTVDQAPTDVILNTTKTVMAYNPQFRGKITIEEPVYMYEPLSLYTKIVSGRINLEFTDTYNNEYLFLISTDNDLQISTNNFFYSIGDFNNVGATEFFVKKSVNITIANGLTKLVYFYRTREKINATVTFKIQ